jgi:hypothetical protein
MFEYAVVFLLILNAISLLHLQYYCFHFRKSIPSVSEVAETKSQTLLETVDEGVQILSDLADILETGSSDSSNPGPVGSSVGALLTNLLISNMASQPDDGSQESQGAVFASEDDSPKEEID